MADLVESQRDQLLILGPIQRITTENTTLKQRVRQLATDNRALDERLKAARSNLRFADRRVADLEARIADPANATQTS